MDDDPTIIILFSFLFLPILIPMMIKTFTIIWLCSLFGTVYFMPENEWNQLWTGKELINRLKNINIMKN